VDGLREALGGAKVGREQALISVENADQRDGRKMMALGQHLGADQDVGTTVARRCKMLVERASAARAVAVHAQHGVIREQRREIRLDALGTDTERQQLTIRTLPARGRRRSFAAAVMAHE
jgi:hypothetical protein